jgi:hypothetical protein
MIDRHRLVGMAGRSARYRRCSVRPEDQVVSLAPADEADEAPLSDKSENNWGVVFHL